MLRELLDDHALAADIVPYIEHAYVLSLTGLRSRRWAIRNVCGLLYAALTRRVFGNSKSRDPSKYDGITGRELFTRFPGLHPFLTNQLEDAVDQLADAETLLNANDDQALDPLGVALRSGARCIHPALYPCLILLSRLQPSPMDTNPTTADPAAADLEEHLAGVVAHAPHFESASGAVAPPMLLENEPLTRVNERNSTVHVTSSSAMLSMYSFTELVEMCVDSPVFKTREMAARAFAPLVPGERVVGVVLSLLKGLREAGTRISANTCHGTLCQIHELLRVHWGGSGVESMRRAFVAQIVPDLAALWPVIVQALDRHEPGSPAIQDTENERSSTESCEKADDVSDIVRHRYLLIINEFVARGELWLLPQSAGGTDTGDDAEFSRSARLVLSRFRISMLYGSLHPLFADRMVLRQLGNAQTLGAYGTVLELTRLFLACVDDRTLAVVKADRTVQLCLEENAVSGIGNQKSRVLYNPWTVLASLLACSDYYEAKLAVLEWLADHVARERMEIFARIGITNLLSVLAADAIDTRVDPVVRAASIRLLAQLCAKLEIDPEDFPVNDLAAFWDQISAQLHGTDMFCPLSVALALTELQATLVHMVYARAVSADEANNAHRRLLAWANHLYEWADPEMATPYRSAVSRALVLYSAIKRFHETNPPDTHKQKQTLAVDTASEQILRLCYWRMLQDDDEEIRDFVAQSISRRLGRQLGCDQACERLIADFAPPPGPLSFPLTYVSNRLAYLLALPPAGECTPVSERAARVVDAAVHPSRILFDHEAPNIYIDQSRNTQLAYYSLVSIADYSVSTPEELKVFVDGAMQCVEALDSARMALANTDALSATSRPTLFPLLQSWILGAQLAVFVASKMECTDGGANDVGANGIIPRVSAVADSWLNSAGLQPVHPWIARALRSLADLCACALAAADSPADATLRISKDRAVADLYLLTYI
ncbi:hypothetical protein EV174_005007 [Coemansia sp. RSA 2320]|nr:hypothetical protein EV174_005007 [Coemansia sp. RSA 2320]